MKDSSDTAGTDNGTRQDEQSGGPDGQMGDVAGSKDGAGMVSGDFSLIGFSSAMYSRILFIFCMSIMTPP